MKTYLLNLGHNIRNAAIGLAALAFFGIVQTPGAEATPFSRIVVFGDSLSDMGNLYEQSGGPLGGTPPPPYAGGRFSNGPLWIEYLAASLGMEVAREDNYAVGGATTGTLNVNNGLAGKSYAGLQQQIAEHLADLPEAGADPEALYVIWAGGNDFFAGGEPSSVIPNGVANTVQAIYALGNAGAKTFLVGNLPDLGLTPLAQSLGAGAAMSYLSTVYNQVLGAQFEALRAAGVEVIEFDAFSVMPAIAAAPEQYGFTNITAPFLAVGGNPDEFLFWDAIHPTTAGHQVVATAAVEDLMAYYLPAKAQANGKGAVNGLNGLVRASAVK